MSRPRLLLIDDEPALARFIANSARDCGFEPRITTEEGEFQRQFIEFQPDVVVLDLGMPGKDGVEQLRFLAEHGCRSPVLLVSGFDQRIIQTAFRLGEALGLNMAGPLTKPVRLDTLDALLTELKPPPGQ